MSETVRERQIREALEREAWEQGARERQVQEELERLELVTELGAQAWAARALVLTQKQVSGDPSDPKKWRQHSCSARRVAEHITHVPGLFPELHEPNLFRLMQPVEVALMVLWEKGIVNADSRSASRVYWWAPLWDPVG